jgi:hypothetical protein
MYETDEPQSCPDWCDLTTHVLDDEGVMHNGTMYAFEGTEPGRLAVTLSGATRPDGSPLGVALAVRADGMTAIHDPAEAAAFAHAVAKAARVVCSRSTAQV